MAAICPVCNKEIGSLRIVLENVPIHPECQLDFVSNFEAWKKKKMEREKELELFQKEIELAQSKVGPRGDEELYLIATQELDIDAKNPALWSKAMALCLGDEQKARYKYIELRVESLKIKPTTEQYPDKQIEKKKINNDIDKRPKAYQLGANVRRAFSWKNNKEFMRLGFLITYPLTLIMGYVFALSNNVRNPFQYAFEAIYDERSFSRTAFYCFLIGIVWIIISRLKKEIDIFRQRKR